MNHHGFFDQRAWLTSVMDTVMALFSHEKNVTTPSAFGSMREKYFDQHKLATTFCQTVLHIDCQNASPTNPQPPTWDNVTAGQSHYDRYCQECHGFAGKGSGATRLNPPPPRLSFAGNNLLHKDIYLFWTIYEGGKPVGSAMPAFSETLKEEEIWQLVLFINTF